MSSEEKYFKFVVSLKSTPGFYAQYAGEVTVWAKDESDAISEALLQLRRGTFKDRSNDMWKVTEVRRSYE
jgi:hypothetical protein